LIIRYYDAETKKLDREMKSNKELAGHSNRVQCCKFSPLKDEILYTGGWDSTLIVYDIYKEGPAMSVSGPHICGEAIDVRKDDGIIMTGSYTDNNCLQFWDLRNSHTPCMTIDWCGGTKDAKGEWINKPAEWASTQSTFGSNAAFLYSAKFTYDGKYVIAGGGTGKNEVRIFRYSDGQLITNIHNLPKSVLSIDTANKKLKFVFGSSDAHIRIGDIVESSKG
jgi:WD40 repeat protein